MLIFISRRSSKKISVVELFPVQRKQKNASSNNFATQTGVKHFSIRYVRGRRQIISGQLSGFWPLRWEGVQRHLLTLADEGLV